MGVAAATAWGLVWEEVNQRLLSLVEFHREVRTNRGFNWARRKLIWTNFEALPRTKYFLQF